MIQKEFETLKDEELCCVQGGGMITTLYIGGYRQPLSIQNVRDTAASIIRLYYWPSIYP